MAESRVPLLVRKQLVSEKDHTRTQSSFELAYASDLSIGRARANTTRNEGAIASEYTCARLAIDSRACG